MPRKRRTDVGYCISVFQRHLSFYLLFIFFFYNLMCLKIMIVIYSLILNTYWGRENILLSVLWCFVCGYNESFFFPNNFFFFRFELRRSSQGEDKVDKKYIQNIDLLFYYYWSFSVLINENMLFLLFISLICALYTHIDMYACI